MSVCLQFGGGGGGGDCIGGLKNETSIFLERIHKWKIHLGYI